MVKCDTCMREVDELDAIKREDIYTCLDCEKLMQENSEGKYTIQYEES